MAWRAHRFIISSEEGFAGDEILKELAVDAERRAKGWERRVTLHPDVEQGLHESVQRVPWSKKAP